MPAVRFWVTGREEVEFDAYDRQMGIIPLPRTGGAL